MWPSTVYFPRFGKGNPEYTYTMVQPIVILVHTGIRWLVPLARVSGGTYRQRYASYRLPALPGCAGQFDWPVSLRQDRAAVLRPALAAFNPQPLQVPDLP